MLYQIKEIIKSNFKYFVFFYRFLKVKFLLTALFSSFVGLLDALSISVFFPLLASVENGKALKSVNKNFDVTYFLNLFGIPNTINWLLLLMVFFFVLKGVFRYLDVYYRVYLTSFFIKKMRKKMLTLVSQMKYSSFVKEDLGLIQNSLTKETDNVIVGFSLYTAVFQNLIFVFVYIFISSISNPKFTLLVLLGGLISSFVFKRFYTNSASISNSITKKNHVFMGLIIQKISNFKYLKATSRINEYKNKIDLVIDDIEKDQVKLGYLSGVVLAIREPFLVLFLATAIFIHINFFGGNILSILFTLILFYRSFSSLTAVQTSWNGFLKYVGSLNHLNEFQTKLVKEKENTIGDSFNGFENDIFLKDICFSFENEKNILKNITLRIKKNQSIAFVGKSGSGKTTLINVITGLLEPSSGDFLIDNMSVKKYSLESYRSKIGFISQESVVFNDTFFNNVSFWEEKTLHNYEKFLEIIKKVDLLDFLENSKDKEETILGDNGVVMSGGQRQRLSIARELYRNTEILVLDEATSALDSETEKLIQNSIETLKGKVTIIVIAHRLSTIKNADLICLLDNGRIEEIGTYENLLNNSDNFAKMVKYQKL